MAWRGVAVFRSPKYALKSILRRHKQIGPSSCSSLHDHFRPAGIYSLFILSQSTAWSLRSSTQVNATADLLTYGRLWPQHTTRNRLPVFPTGLPPSSLIVKFIVLNNSSSWRQKVFYHGRMAWKISLIPQLLYRVLQGKISGTIRPKFLLSDGREGGRGSTRHCLLNW